MNCYLQSLSAILILVNEAKVESFEQESKRAEKPPRAQIIKANVVSQISNAIGKHKVALPSDVLSKFASRGRNRPKEDVVTQLEEVGLSFLCLEYEDPFYMSLSF